MLLSMFLLAFFTLLFVNYLLNTIFLFLVFNSVLSALKRTRVPSLSYTGLGISVNAAALVVVVLTPEDLVLISIRPPLLTATGFKI